MKLGIRPAVAEAAGAAEAVKELATDAREALSDMKEQVSTGVVITPLVLGVIATCAGLALVLAIVAVARRG